MMLLTLGYRLNRMSMIIPGSILGGLGIGLFYLYSGRQPSGIQLQISILLLSFGASWALITLMSSRVAAKTAWWALIPAAVFMSAGCALLVSTPDPIILSLFILTSLGTAFLIWGVSAHLFGLIIPGCLLASLGPGIYLSWGRSAEPSALSQTGVLLVSFALGWGLITLFSRTISPHFLWWPLIPAGVLAVIGWGLYIGGNPGNAVNFLSNTGSLGLVIFGLYLLLWQKNLRK
jgi:hypothetical protein